MIAPHVRVTLLCLLAASAGCAASGSASHADAGAANAGTAQHSGASADVSTGAIAGDIDHPAHVLPPMRICAIGGDPATSRCVRSRAHQSTYRIDRVPPGDYIVIAAVEGSPFTTGGHVREVQCIRAPCPPMPAEVRVVAGATTEGIDLNGFYRQRDDFPAMPPP